MNKYNSLKQLLFIFEGIILLSFSYQNVQAADTNPDYQHALDTAPKGLKWSDDTFVIADFQKAAENRRRNSLIKDFRGTSTDHHSSLINNVEIQTINDKTSVIKMTNDNWQTGAVWSNKDKSNYFDIDKEQIASMWLYFGKTNSDPSDLPGDGMAFVLQNDPNGGDSIALSANGIPVNGQSLGVWGADWDIENDDPKKLAATAIQNSWALEFDTFANMERTNITGEGVSFDSELANISRSGRHIAGNYPASPDTYQFGVGYPYYFSMNHNNLKYRTNLVDSKWHHVTIKWTPTQTDQGTLTYKYDDKDPDTGMPIENPVTSTFTLDTKKFGLTKDNRKLYWGFTGSTGRNSENNLVIFESIPSFVDAKATSSIHDNVQNQDINDKYDTVDPNTNISYKYNLEYVGWSKNWHDINAIMGVPSYVHFTSGTVTYPDSLTNNKPQPIPESVFQNENATQLEYLLPEQLDHVNSKAIIELNGTTEKKVSTQLTVPKVHASFEGDNLITDTTTQSFKIRSRALSLESDSPNPIKTNEGMDVTIPGKVSYADPNIAPDYQNLNVYQTLNGVTTNLGKIVDEYGNFNIQIDSYLLDKINTLTFYVTDDDNNQSNTIMRQILLGGNLAFGHVQEKIAFKPVNGSYTKKVIPRSDNWQIDVVDSRNKGSQWSVQAKATDLKTINNKFLNGKIIYRDSKGKTHYLDNNINVATNTKDSDDTQTKNITDNWTSNDGILLLMNKGNQAGIYSGQISWSLLDSIPNE